VDACHSGAGMDNAKTLSDEPQHGHLNRIRKMNKQEQEQEREEEEEKEEDKEKEQKQEPKEEKKQEPKEEKKTCTRTNKIKRETQKQKQLEQY